MPLEKVNRGDLITADLINALIDEIGLLKQQLARTGNAPVISRIDPDNKGRVGDWLDFSGQNFGNSQGKPTVTFDGIPVIEYKQGETDTHMALKIPETLNI